MLTKKHLLQAIAHMPDDACVQIVQFDVALVEDSKGIISLHFGDPDPDNREPQNYLWLDPTKTFKDLVASPLSKLEDYVTNYKYTTNDESNAGCVRCSAKKLGLRATFWSNGWYFYYKTDGLVSSIDGLKDKAALAFLESYKPPSVVPANPQSNNPEDLKKTEMPRTVGVSDPSVCV